MNSIDDNLLPPAATVLNAVEKLERSWLKVVLVTDSERRLLGSITDGDIRRALLRGAKLSDPVTSAMNPKPKSALISEDRGPVVEWMRRNILRHMPIVDGDGRVVAIETLHDLTDYHWRENWVVILAGGEGKRLRPLTEDCPKPMLPVGGRPILELIIERLHHFGYRKVFISINYLGHLIRDYFGDGSKFGVDIRYLVEDKRLGTAGALSLLPEIPAQPLMVINGDILTAVDFGALMDFHVERHHEATMCVREYAVTVPFGVVDVENHRVVSLREKPELNFTVNAGIYVLDPHVLLRLEINEHLDMTSVFDRMIADNLHTGVYMILDYWLDIGRTDDLTLADSDYHRVFGKAKSADSS